MINPLEETLLTFPEARLLEELRRNKKPPSLQAIYRWTNYGIRGVRLEFIQRPCGRCTSREAILRFFERLTAPPGTDRASTPKQVQRAHEQAVKFLRANGIK